MSDPRKIPWTTAEVIAGKRLDRRLSYGLVCGEVCVSCSWTTSCSGCSSEDPYEAGPGMGCHECGHTGKRRNSMWIPLRHYEVSREVERELAA